MSRPLIPRPSSGEPELGSPVNTQKPRKISTACGACKQRKTRCSGTNPCEACAARSSPCVYDVTSDQRRKVANQKNISDLAQAQTQLERFQQLVGGMIALLRTGDPEAERDLVDAIRSGFDLSQLAAHVRNTRLGNPQISASYAAINFYIDGDEELASPTTLLGSMPSSHRGLISGQEDGIPAFESVLDGPSHDLFRSHQ